jgi:site-specific recombinase XerD
LHAGANPFKQYKITTYPTRKEKLTMDEITAIEILPLTGQLKSVRDLFLFSFYAKGARFENCIFLRPEDVKNGRIYFKTNKGKKYISVALSDKVQSLLPSVFSFIKQVPTGPLERLQLKDSANSIVNKHLKVIGAMAGIKTHLTFHLARHSLAMAMKRGGATVQVIKDVLGHSDTRTTEIYLKGLDDECLDEEMRKVYG